MLRRKWATVLGESRPLTTPATSCITPCSRLLNMALVKTEGPVEPVEPLELLADGSPEEEDG